MKQLTKTAIALFGATTLGFAGFGAYSFADKFWQGHNNMVQINSDLDQLSQIIKNKNDQLTKAKSDLANAQNQLKATQSSQSTLQDQLKSVQEQLEETQNIKTSIQDSLNQQLGTIQQALIKCNAIVQAKQKEVNKANQQVSDLNNKINDLTNQLNKKNQASPDLSQAVKEAQDTRDYADTVVENSK